MLENIPHAKAFSLYEQADLVIDQLLIGWYGTFAVECMSIGKPIITRIAEEDLHFLPRSMSRDLQRAVINASPSTIYETLKRCIEDRKILQESAIACFEYACRWHNSQYVGSLTKDVYENALDSNPS